jgi:hypothetical protein
MTVLNKGKYKTALNIVNIAKKKTRTNVRVATYIIITNTILQCVLLFETLSYEILEAEI